MKLSSVYLFICLSVFPVVSPSQPHDPLILLTTSFSSSPSLSPSSSPLTTPDEIEYPPPRPPLRDIIGGAGTYSALGARLFSPSPTLSRKVGWIVDQGSDFPASITSLITSWDSGVLFRSTPDRLTTRGWNGYAEGGANRAFKYLTPKKRLAGKDLEGTALLFAKSFHIISGPNRCRELVNEIIGLRKDAAERGEGPGEYTRPIFVWEPVPDLCTPDELLNCTNTLPLIDVCSPNHAELGGFMGTSGILSDGSPDTGAVEAACEQLLASMPLQSYTLVVRAGERGCYIAKNGGRKRHPTTKLLPNKKATKKKKREYGGHGGLSHDTDMFSLFAGLMQDDDGVVAREEIEVDPGIEKWVPAYHADQKKVVDATGGGNTFLGGMAVALARGCAVEEAAVWGTVAAGFAIEQVGV
ncbi:Ribokinase-like protein, partial [Coniochaeta sp. 2T2.1]